MKQPGTDVLWGSMGNRFMDMPPETGDVSLTVFPFLLGDGVVTIGVRILPPHGVAGMIELFSGTWLNG